MWPVYTRGLIPDLDDRDWYRINEIKILMIWMNQKTIVKNIIGCNCYYSYDPNKKLDTPNKLK